MSEQWKLTHEQATALRSRAVYWREVRNGEDGYQRASQQRRELDHLVHALGTSDAVLRMAEFCLSLHDAGLPTDQLDGAVARLVEAAERLARLQRLPNESRNDWFERLAEWFYSEKHMLPPGKGSALGEYTEEERRITWDAWHTCMHQEARAALTPFKELHRE